MVILELGLGRVALPHALERKYPNAGKEWGWQWVFPATSHYTDRETGEQRRYYLHVSVLQKVVKQAVRRTGWQSPQLRTRFAIHSPHTCFKAVTTFAQFKNSWATKT